MKYTSFLIPTLFSTIPSSLLLVLVVLDTDIYLPGQDFSNCRFDLHNNTEFQARISQINLVHVNPCMHTSTLLSLFALAPNSKEAKPSVPQKASLSAATHQGQFQGSKTTRSDPSPTCIAAFAWQSSPLVASVRPGLGSPATDRRRRHHSQRCCQTSCLAK
jgi:hypothetical protein